MRCETRSTAGINGGSAVYAADPSTILYRDYETRSTIDLKKVGAWTYAQCPDTAVWCCAYAVDNGLVQIWVPGDPMPPEFAEAANNPNWVVSAFNDSFERQIEQHIMAPRYSWPIVPIERHRCSQAAALALALPASLSKVADALGLEQHKDIDGRRLMLQMSRPRLARKEEPDGIYWYDDEERRARLYQYCKTDVAVERAVHERIGHLPPDEQRLWELDAAINDRGISIDRKLVAGAIVGAENAHVALNDELCAITGGAVETVAQTGRLLKWLGTNGCELKDLQKATISTALPRTPDRCKRVLEIRQEGAHIAAAKYAALRNWTGADGRVRGTLKYHAAATGRWASYGTQLQNLKKLGNAADLAGAIERISNGTESSLGTIGQAVRAAIVAAPGRRFIAGDFSGVESRLTAWLSGEQTKLDQWSRFDQSGDPEDEPYRLVGLALGFPQEQARSRGKIADLAFGYRGGIGAYRRLAPDGDRATDDEVEAQKRAWRKAHPATVKLWSMLNISALRAVANPGKEFRVNERLSFCSDGTFLKLKLPSGRDLSYPFSRLEDDERGGKKIIFKDNAAGKFVDCRQGQGAWPGLWIENCVQAVARDLLAAALLRLEAAGYPVVLHIHDEVVTELEIGRGSVEEFHALLTELPPWAAGLPTAAKCRDGPRLAHAPTPLPAVPPWEGSRMVPEAAVGGDDESSDHAANGNGYAAKGYAAGERRSGRIITEYIYRDAAGRPFHRVTRMHPKSFPQAIWKEARWQNGAPAIALPYRLPELLSAGEAEMVFICEGEKDADNVAALGLVATTAPSGAGKWPVHFSRWFIGKQRVVVLADNDAPGREHVRQVADNLSGTVTDIRVVEFPELPAAGDVSDWLEQGHGKAELLERAGEAPAYKRKVEIRVGGALMRKKLPPRAWLLANTFCRKFLSQILADGGVGKTATRYAQYLALVCGRPITGEHVFVRCRVLIISLEDGFDELERRLQAAARHHGVTDSDMDGWLFYCAVSRDAGKIKVIDEKGRLADGGLIKLIEEIVVERKIDLVALDPFVKTHSVGENDNSAIDAVAQLLTDLADKHNVGVDCPHHTRKGSHDPGNAQSGRGASALIDAGRLIKTLQPMSSDEAKAFGIPDEDRHGYVRVDKGKANILPPGRVAQWFKLVGVELGNATETYPSGDSVQTVEPWTPPDICAGLDVELQNIILDTIEAGLPNGARYSDASNASERAAWKVVRERCPDQAEGPSRELIKRWIRDGVLETREYEDTGQRKKRKGLYVNAARRPK